MRSQAALVKRHFELVQEELGLSSADVEAERAKAAAADKRPSAGSFNNGHASTGSEYRDRKRAAGARTAGRRVQTPTATKYHVATRYNR